jgi:hypothetical protein
MSANRFITGSLLLFNLILSVSVINLGFFAKQGARYTATDGALERAERIQGDQELSARIDALCASAAVEVPCGL